MRGARVTGRDYHARVGGGGRNGRHPADRSRAARGPHSACVPGWPWPTAEAKGAGRGPGLYHNVDRSYGDRCGAVSGGRRGGRHAWLPGRADQFRGSGSGGGGDRRSAESVSLGDSDRARRRWEDTASRRGSKKGGRPVRRRGVAGGGGGGPGSGTGDGRGGGGAGRPGPSRGGGP